MRLKNSKINLFIYHLKENEMIPRAEEARKQTTNNIENRTTKVLEEISEKYQMLYKMENFILLLMN